MFIKYTYFVIYDNSLDYITDQSLPLSLQIHVRAKNVNGWSQWSNFGYIMQGEKEWNDELYVWLYFHSLEQYYQQFIEFGVTTIEDLMHLTSSDLSSMSTHCEYDE